MSAVFNFLGVLVMTQINSSVASTISNMVDFSGDTSAGTRSAVCCFVFHCRVQRRRVLFGIPTSESHSLIAGLSGAAIAIHNGIGGINMSEWAKVLYGLVLSLALGFAIGWVVCKLVTGDLSEYGSAQDKSIFSGRSDFRRSGDEFYARRAGRPEIYGRAVSWSGVL